MSNDIQKNVVWQAIMHPKRKRGELCELGNPKMHDDNKDLKPLVALLLQLTWLFHDMSGAHTASGARTRVERSRSVNPRSVATCSFGGLQRSSGLDVHVVFVIIIRRFAVV